MSKTVVVYHSGYGHTQRIAQTVAEGADAHLVAIDAEGNVSEADWAVINAADAIIFGSPTYMGMVSWQFKKFADATSKQWMSGAWKDKVAGGFTCSQNMSGDKYSTLMYFVTLAMQHGMVWVGTGMMPPRQPGHPDELNRLGSSIGVMAQADNVPPEQSPPKGDLDTARAYGKRLAEKTRALRR